MMPNDLTLDTLVQKYWNHSIEVLNPDRNPEGMEGTRANDLVTKLCGMVEEYSFEELMYAFRAALVLTAIAMDERLNPEPTKGITTEQVLDMVTEIGDEDLLRVWFALGQQPAQERPVRLTEGVRAELVKRGMPVVPLSEI